MLVYVPLLLYFLLEFVRRDAIKEERNNRGSSILIGVSFFLMIVIPPRIHVFQKSGNTETFFFYSGIIASFLGIWIRYSAMKTLGRFYSRNVSIQGEHQLIREGWYRLIRHPGYLGTFITFLGYGCATKSWLSIPVIVILFFMAYAYRIHIEEKVLVSRFGQDYIDYQKRTWRLIPYVY
jgi:protein-S-isoprenylcysteine O-methyltransferase Ste14